ncbi:hypothetical protein NQ315_016194, partial [Exocentrus adspersus]
MDEAHYRRNCRSLRPLRTSRRMSEAAAPIPVGTYEDQPTLEDTREDTNASASNSETANNYSPVNDFSGIHDGSGIESSVPQTVTRSGREFPVQELPVQENSYAINIDDIPIIFEDQLLSALSCENSQNHNQTSDQCMPENNNQNTDDPNQSLPKTNENIISIDSRPKKNVTVQVPSTSDNSKRKVEENSNSESCSNGSVYEPEQTGEESSSSASEEEREINLPETQLEQPMYGNMEEGRKRKKKPNQAEWKKKRNEKLREKGKEYLGYSRSRDGSLYVVLYTSCIADIDSTGATCNNNPSSAIVEYLVSVCFLLGNGKLNMSSTTSSDEDKNTTPPKKQKRLCVYKKEWEKDYAWLRQARTFECGSAASCSTSSAFCVVCKKMFIVSHGGLNDVKRHANRADHINHIRAQQTSQTLTAFLKIDRGRLDTDEELILAAEVTKVYHLIKHTQSFNSTDCESKLCATIFPDSKIAKKIALGRTKASSIAHNVLGPASTEIHIRELQMGSYYSVSTDASNHGSSKLFPVLLRYFNPDDGVILFLLDFFEDSDETANAICNNLKEKLQDAGLNLLKMSSYSADNASVNFGKHHSVYRLLKNENEHLVPVGCPAHMLHNASKNALDKCNFDVETLVLKVYCHFSIPLQKYFPEETEGESASGKERTLTECYLAFFDNILKLLYDTVLALEKNNLMCCEVYFVLQTLRNKLNQRVTDKFVGFLCSNMLKSFSPGQQNAAMKEFMQFYSNVWGTVKSSEVPIVYWCWSPRKRKKSGNVLRSTKHDHRKELKEAASDQVLEVQQVLQVQIKSFSQFSKANRILQVPPQLSQSVFQKLYAPAATFPRTIEKPGQQQQPRPTPGSSACTFSTSLLYPRSHMPNSERLDQGNENPAPHIELASMSFTTEFAFKIIPHFDGDRQNLHKYISCCQVVWDSATTRANQQMFLNIAKARLSGPAYNLIKYKNINDWDSLKTVLQEQYLERRTIAQIQRELLSTRQNFNEDVSSFANRIEMLTLDLDDACIASEGQASKTVIQNLNAKSALKAFVEGLQPNLKFIIKASRYTEIHEAVEAACEEERNIKTNKPLFNAQSNSFKDSGSDISLLKLSRLDDDETIFLDHKIKLQGITKEHVSSIGIIFADIHLSANAKLNYEMATLTIPTTTTEFSFEIIRPSQISVPARTELVARIHSDFTSPKLCLQKEIKPGFYVGNCVVEPKDGLCTIPLINSTEEPIQILNTRPDNDGYDLYTTYLNEIERKINENITDTDNPADKNTNIIYFTDKHFTVPIDYHSSQHELIAQEPEIRDIAYLKSDDTYFIYLVTRETQYHRSDYKDIFFCFQNLKDFAIANKIDTLTLFAGHSHEIARETLLKRKETSKTGYDKVSKPLAIKIGDKVLLKNESPVVGNTKKLQPLYQGPYEVISVDSDVNCTIMNVKFGKKAQPGSAQSADDSGTEENKVESTSQGDQDENCPVP